LPVIAYTEETAYEHARIWAELAAAGKMIGYHDLIVPQPRLNVAAKWRHSIKHFSAVPG